MGINERAKATLRPRISKKCDEKQKPNDLKGKSSENCWLSPTVPRSVLRSVGRLNFLPGPLTETKEQETKHQLIPLQKKIK